MLLYDCSARRRAGNASGQNDGDAVCS
jgi:hypothetical protein